MSEEGRGAFEAAYAVAGGGAPSACEVEAYAGAEGPPGAYAEL